MVKNPLADAGDLGLIAGLGRSPGGENGNPTPVVLPGKSPGQRSLAGLQSVGSQRIGHDLTNTQ